MASGELIVVRETKLTDEQDWDRAVAIAKRLESRAGCCVHIVLEDMNIEDDHVAYCEGYAAGVGHQECRELAGWLRRLKPYERAMFVHNLDGSCGEQK